jgi:Prokaryotic N-terminal methylation motif
MTRKAYRGLSLIEVALGLAIGAILLTAVATAVKASADSMRTNEDYFFATQTARVSLANLVTTVRTCYVAEVGAGPGAGSSTAAGSYLYVTPVKGDPSIAYFYDSESKRLLFVPKNAGSPDAPPSMTDLRNRADSTTNPDVFVVARNVTRLTFKGEYAPRLDPTAEIDPSAAEIDPSDLIPWLVDCQIDMTVAVNNQSLHLCESVTPRLVFKQK